MWLDRTKLLIGAEGLARLKAAHVLVVGLGGVGAYAAEMLCRAGIGRMTIADTDEVSPTNRNRQLLALVSTEGQPKSALMAARLRDINPQLQLSVHHAFLCAENISEVLSGGFDYVVDAIDTLAPKVALIAHCLQENIPIVSSMGAGAKMDATKVTISDVSKSHHCPLAHQLRKRLHRLGIRTGFQVVYSTEMADANAVAPVEERNKKSIAGTISYLPPVFGCFCAQTVIKTILN
jgi:tRNA A37 threonylcarbamoyladenosine dehydratase